MNSTTRTEDRVSLLIRLWRDGASARQIACALGDGVTRSAVIGKAHRLGLGGEGRSSRASRAVRRSAGPHRQPPRLRETQQPSAAPQTPAEPGLATLLTVGRHDCRWPLGDPLTEGFTFCGRPVARGSYCARHAELAYRPSRRRPPRDRLARLADLG